VTAQKWDPERYAREARYVSDLGEPVVSLLAPRAGERVLDLGCGDGALTARIVAAGCSVLGVDASQEMVAAARPVPASVAGSRRAGQIANPLALRQACATRCANPC
jgi:2-polyprenyl-3-methyl-5-hydroxy-6-metoxy-1,4-benzoquinol methylase